MSSLDQYKNRYNKVLQISYIISLSVFILLFYFLQRQLEYEYISPRFQAPEMTIIQIPRTIQRLQPKPKPIRPVIPVPTDELEILDEVSFELQEATEIVFGSLEGTSQKKVNLSMMPRQIVEVVPNFDDEEVHGVVVLSLYIGVDGKIKKFKVVSNTTNNQECLREVLSAARRSKWQPAMLDGEPVEFWIEKSYKIN